MTATTEHVYSQGVAESPQPQAEQPGLSPIADACHDAKASGNEAPVASDRAATMGVHRHGQQGQGASARHFLRHYFEMCIAMCIGWAALGALFLWGTRQMGYASPYSQLPELSVLVAASAMTVPMVAWMRFRGMEWSPIAEMSAAMFVEAIVLIGLSWLGILLKGSLVNWLHVFMMPVMLIPMLFRLDLYTGRTGHHAHAA